MKNVNYKRLLLMSLLAHYSDEGQETTDTKTPAGNTEMRPSEVDAPCDCSISSPPPPPLNRRIRDDEWLWGQGWF
jgi:hypothetical protein